MQLPVIGSILQDFFDLGSRKFTGSNGNSPGMIIRVDLPLIVAKAEEMSEGTFYIFKAADMLSELPIIEYLNNTIITIRRGKQSKHLDVFSSCKLATTATGEDDCPTDGYTSKSLKDDVSFYFSSLTLTRLN